MDNTERTLAAKKIFEEYTERTPDKIDELIALDREVKRPVKAAAYAIGIAGSLILGSRMCFAMGVVGKRKLPGIILGCAGIGVLAANYNLYKKDLAARKAEYSERIKKIGDEILAEEIEKENVIEINEVVSSID